MARRTSPDAVKAILLDNFGSKLDGAVPKLDGFIDSASATVDRVYTCAAGKTPPITLSSTELELIERWLAAHMYAMADPMYTSRTTGKASGAFQGQTQMGLDYSPYGQMAKRLDWSGCLEALDKRKFVGAAWLGRNRVSQTDYDDRN